MRHIRIVWRPSTLTQFTKNRKYMNSDEKPLLYKTRMAHTNEQRKKYRTNSSQATTISFRKSDIMERVFVSQFVYFFIFKLVDYYVFFPFLTITLGVSLCERQTNNNVIFLHDFPLILMDCAITFFGSVSCFRDNIEHVWRFCLSPFYFSNFFFAHSEDFAKSPKNDNTIFVRYFTFRASQSM